MVESESQNCKSIAEKYKFLKEVGQGTSCDEILIKYDIAKQALSNFSDQPPELAWNFIYFLNYFS